MEKLLRIRLDIKITDPENFKRPGARYRIYLNDLMLTERFYPDDLLKEEQLEENIFLMLEPRLYEVKVENLSTNRIYITDLAVDQTAYNEINDYSYSFNIQ